NIEKDNAILDKVKKQNDLKDNSFIISTYLKLKELPILGKIISSQRIKAMVKKVLPKQEKIISPDKLLDGTLNKNNVFIESFHGKSFAGDPKHLALYLQSQNPKLHFFVSSANEMVDMEILNHQMIPLRI